VFPSLHHEQRQQQNCLREKYVKQMNSPNLAHSCVLEVESVNKNWNSFYRVTEVFIEAYFDH
jgi:hypothetical protein